MDKQAPNGGGRFPSTHWSLVQGACAENPAGKREHLSRLLNDYLPPLRGHLLRKGIPADQADDHLQSFVADKIIQKQLLGLADRRRGRFRSFLVKSLENFVRDRIESEMAAKRGGGRVLPLDERRDIPAVARPPDAFDQDWARQVLKETLQRMRECCEAQKRLDVWGIFACRVLDPLLEGAQPPPYDELAARFMLASPAQAGNLLITAKRMFERTLREVVAQFVDQEEVDGEIDDLVAALAGRA